MLFWILFVSLCFIVIASLFYVLEIITRFRGFSILVGKLLYLWSRLALAFYFVEVLGKENMLKGPCIIFSNHQGILDIPILISLLTQPFSFFIRHDLASIPVFGWVLKRLGNIFVKRDSPKNALTSFRQGIAMLKGGVSLCIFPEATWSFEGPMPFKKKGLYYLAKRTKMPLLPITIIGSNKANPPDSLRFFNHKLKVVIQKPIYIDEHNWNSAHGFLADMEKVISKPFSQQRAMF